MRFKRFSARRLWTVLVFLKRFDKNENLQVFINSAAKVKVLCVLAGGLRFSSRIGGTGYSYCEHRRAGSPRWGEASGTRLHLAGGIRPLFVEPVIASVDLSTLS